MEKLRSAGVPLHRVAMMVRIADDDIAISSVLCKSCVAKIGSAVYPPPLKHASEQEGTVVCAVDIALELNGPLYKITRLNRNAEFCVTGVVRQARTRFLPALKPPLVCRNTRVGWLAGSLALGFQREPSVSHCRCQGLLACAELIHLKHTPKEIESALRSIQHPHLRSTALYLASVMKCLVLLNPPLSRLPATLYQFLLPWITLRGGVGIIPGAVKP